jgi:uncharacterized protein (TIGR00369 family)
MKRGAIRAGSRNPLRSAADPSRMAGSHSPVRSFGRSVSPTPLARAAAMPTDADLRQFVERATAMAGHTGAIGLRVVAAERGRVEMALDRRPDLLQFSGSFHGGVVATLADHLAGAAVTTALPAGRIAVTVDLHVNYLAPANGDALTATARAIRVGSAIGVAQVEVTTRIDGADRQCAVALATLRVADAAAFVKPPEKI